MPCDRGSYCQEMGKEIKVMEEAACLQLAHRMASLQPSATLAMAARAGAMKASGIDVIDLSVGEPDFPTPEHIMSLQLS